MRSRGFCAFWRAGWVFEEFDNPEATAFVPCHGDWVDDVGFGGEEADFEAGWDGEGFGKVGAERRRRSRRCVGTGELFACGRCGGLNTQTEIKGKVRESLAVRLPMVVTRFKTSASMRKRQRTAALHDASRCFLQIRLLGVS